MIEVGKLIEELRECMSTYTDEERAALEAGHKGSCKYKYGGPERRAMMQTFVRYIKSSINNREQEGCDFMSALVNTIDTARECPEKFTEGLQHERELEIGAFLLAHTGNDHSRK